MPFRSGGAQHDLGTDSGYTCSVGGVVVDPTDPDAAHGRLFGARRQRAEAVNPRPDPHGAVPEGWCRWVFISDTHGAHARAFDPAQGGEPLPAGDVLVHCGDFTNAGELGQVRSFVEWFGRQPHPHKILVAGNHDVTLDAPYYDHRGRARFHPGTDAAAGRARRDEAARAVREGAFVYLDDAGCTVLGHQVWGSPASPEFCDWAFNLQRGGQCAARWARIPSATDVLITHGPPLGHGDLCDGGHRAGCVDLLAAVTDRVRPAVHAFGHIHEGAGLTSNGTTTFVNASTLNSRYKPANRPVVVDLPRK